MFDPITPARLVAMLGELLRDSARWERPLDEFRSSQLLSASSIARYLSAEMEGAGVHLAWFAAEADELAASAQAAAREPEWKQALVRARSQLAPAPSTVADPSVHAREMGAAGTEVLRAARSTSDPGAARFAASFRRLLAELADRHVALLGAPAESR
jgi:hypothetical protein